MAAMRVARASILVVDDDRELAPVLVAALELADYRVWHAADGQDARRQVEHLSPDLIVLDLMLPDVDGLVLCSVLKSMSDAPIVICSASARRGDSVLALKLGADDFIKKPFELDDLLARIEAVLRRAKSHVREGVHAPKPTESRVGSLVVEPARRRATVAGAQLILTPTEMRLLSVLAAQEGRILSRDYLAQQVWGYTDVAQGRTIDVHIRRLRMKLSTGARGPTILSARGMGYRLTAEETAISAA